MNHSKASNIKRITLLGSGTSTGVPEPGCFCRVCLSEDPRDKRGRTSVLLETKSGETLLVDCSPDFHRQSILVGLSRVDAILISHEHYDHIGGLDDLRTFAWYHPIKIISYKRVLDAIRHRLHYYFGANRYAGTPDLELIEIEKEKPFQMFGLTITPIEVMHGRLPIFGYRIDDFVFFTDLKTIDPLELKKANHPKLLFINALRPVKPHPSHQTQEEALHIAKELGAEKTVLIHLSHHAPLMQEFPSLLPPNVEAGYDGLTYECGGQSFYKASDEKNPLTYPVPYRYRDLGKIEYEEALTLQKDFFRGAIETKLNGETPCNQLLFCEHNPVYTLGKHGDIHNLLQGEEPLKKRGIKLFRIERGGDITYHGPGQLVGYPIFDLAQFGMGIKEYIYTIEQCIIDFLRANGLQGERVKGATGIWLGVGTPAERKICAIGVYASRYVTMHGFALNVFTDLSYFEAINPCGFTDKGVTSLAKEMSSPTSMNLVKQQLEEAFHRRFREAMKKTLEKQSLEKSTNYTTKPFI